MAGDTGDHEGLAALAALLERVAEAVLNEQSTESGCSFVHFGDLDFAGLTHYIQLRNRLGDAITFWSPQDIGVDLFKHLGNRVLFKRQMSSAKYSIENLRRGLRGDEDALHILRLIVETGCVIEQEALHNEFLRPRD